MLRAPCSGQAQAPCIHIPALPPLHCVTLGKSCNFSVPQRTHLSICLPRGDPPISLLLLTFPSPASPAGSPPGPTTNKTARVQLLWLDPTPCPPHKDLSHLFTGPPCFPPQPCCGSQGARSQRASQAVTRQQNGSPPPPAHLAGVWSGEGILLKTNPTPTPALGFGRERRVLWNS